MEIQNVPYGTQPTDDAWLVYEYYFSEKDRAKAIRDHRKFHATFDLGTKTQTFFRPQQPQQPMQPVAK